MKQLLLSLAVITILLPACKEITPLPIEKGVLKELAQYRKERISNPEYQLYFSIPEEKDQPIMAKEDLYFELNKTDQDLQIDFREKASKIHSVNCNGSESQYYFEKEHLVIPASELKKGKNHIHIEFEAGTNSLNRNHEYLYTLFVPDRARTAFPCFDQPDLKAAFTLRLEIPTQWVAVANGKLKTKSEQGNRTTYSYEKTKPLPTYLFSFVAGKFESITREHKGKNYTLFHRETDPEKLDNNVDAIFNMMFNSLDWLEDYTGIDYPFAKYDLIAIPSFQYGGMEHTGATLYKARTLFLEKDPSQTELLKRANLIAHETAHMWFGDLVTMKWFDQVWLKEVFANFMADKVVNPSFPNINHELNFLMNHYPSAYSVDRTTGANPINQQLPNLKDAGTLYGSIIYHKSPIVMRNLEKITGEQRLQEGVREYLKNYSYGNATWEDLISLLDAKTDFDLKNWSRVWVDEPNRPHLYSEIQMDSGNKISKLIVHQVDLQGKNRIWSQDLSLILGYGNQSKEIKINIPQPNSEIAEAIGLSKPDYIVLNGKGQGYGYFKMNEFSKSYLLKNVSKLKNEILRGTCWLNLYENLVEGTINGDKFIPAVLQNLPSEENILIKERILSYTKAVYWNYLTPNQRKKIGQKLETLLWKQIQTTPDAGLKSSFFSALVSISQTQNSLNRLYRIWDGKEKIKGLHLSERRITSLACHLALKMEEKAGNILLIQVSRISNPDRKARLEFILPSLSPDTEVRDNFFKSLDKPENREQEPWVTEAVGYLNHPLRQEHAQKYLRHSLELLQEIQETGDIFFPKSWLNATYGGHNSIKAGQITLEFLQNHPNYPQTLKLKILQAADRVLRKIK
ncbi:MAG: M1 family metallopeptidase [Marinifilaceae bacterium]